MNEWRRARVTGTSEAAERIRSITVIPEQWVPHRAGQHYDLRIAGTDISRKYSVVSSPFETDALEFGVQLLSNGVVSPKLWSLNVGDEVEIRGPWGESFIWTPDMKGPLVLIGAGSGITPLLSIHEAYRQSYPEEQATFIMSAKTEGHMMHYAKIKSFLIGRYTSRDPRIDKDFLAKHAGDKAGDPRTKCYVCGPEDFIDSVVDDLLDLGFPEGGIKSEKFT